MHKTFLVAHWDWVLYHFRMPIARTLREHGLDVSLVSPSGPYVAKFESEGFRWLEWRVERRSMNPVSETPALMRLTRLYRDERPHVVHHFTVKPNLYGSVAARLAGVPVVLNMFSGLGYVFSDDSRARWLQRGLRPVMRWAFVRQGVWMLALNEPDMSALRRQGLADPGRSRLMPEGVDLSGFSPPDAPPDNEVPVVVLACRLLREKGVPELVEAARLLDRQGVPVHVQIAGEADTGNPGSVTDEEIAEWSADGLVEFLGKRDDMDAVLRRADIAVLPSRYKEGLPRFLLEAAATGLPLIATDIPGCRDIVRQGETGFLVPVQEPGELADAIARLATDADLRQQMGNENRSFVEEEFGMQRVVDEHIRLYRDVGVLDREK